MSRKGRVRKTLQGIEIMNVANPVLAEPCSTKELEASISREQQHANIAETIERRFLEVTQSSLAHWQAEIQNIDFDDYRLLVSIAVPFVLPSDPFHRRERTRLREDFAEFLFKRENQKKLSNQLLHPMLVAFLIDTFSLKHLDSRIMKRLKRLPQRSSAGRPTEPVPSDMQMRITKEGKAIYRKLQDIRGQVEKWQKKLADLNAAMIRLKLRKRYPAAKFKWMPHFLTMSSKLPRRRYYASERNQSAFSEVTSLDASVPSCQITEPRAWSIIDIATKVTQAHLLQETGKQIALLRIRALIR